MTDAELTQFKELAKKYEPKDKDQVLDVLKADVHEVFQDINDGGRAAANRDNEKKVTALTAERDQFKTAAEKAAADLAELNGKAPDAAKLREQFDRQLADIRRETDEKLSQKDRQLLGEKTATATTALTRSLISQGIDPEYATEVVVRREDVLNRIKPQLDGETQILKRGSDLPLVPPGDGKTAVDLLATELAGAIEPKWKTSKVRRGSGTDGNKGGGDSSSTNLYDTIRTETKTRTEAQATAQQKKSTGLERLRGR